MATKKKKQRNTVGTIAHWCVFMSEYPQQGVKNQYILHNNPVHYVNI